MDKEQSLGGIIHLHDITQARMITSLKRSLEVFSCLCGDSAYPRIVLGTTKWPTSEVIQSSAGRQVKRSEKTHGSPRKQAEDRFRQMQENYWKDLIEQGSRPYQIETEESPLELVRSILDKLELTIGGEKLELQLPKEVVDEGKTVPKTKAGKILEMEGRKKSRYGSMTKEEKAVEKFIQKQLKEMDRELKELATGKNMSSKPLKWLTKVFGDVCRLFSH